MRSKVKCGKVEWVVVGGGRGGDVERSVGCLRLGLRDVLCALIL